MYCVVLYRVVLYCIVLYCIVLCCIVLYCVVLTSRVKKIEKARKYVLYCIVSYRAVLNIGWYCMVLYIKPHTHTCRYGRGARIYQQQQQLLQQQQQLQQQQLLRQQQQYLPPPHLPSLPPFPGMSYSTPYAQQVHIKL